MGKWGIKPDIANPGTENIINGIKKGTGIVFIESVTNPILRVNDISTISEKCHDVGIYGEEGAFTGAKDTITKIAAISTPIINFFLFIIRLTFQYIYI